MATFLLDHNIAFNVSIHLRARGHAAYLARELRLARAEDDEILVASVQRGAILVTHNADDFALLHFAWQRWARLWGVEPRPRHSGILVVIPPPQLRLGPESLAAQLETLVESGLEIENRLYVWRRNVGWRDISAVIE